MSKAKILGKNDIRHLLEVKDFNNKNCDGQDSNPDCSEKSDLSAIPQYSSYRTLSGGLFGPFEDAPAKPSSRTFFRRTPSKADDGTIENEVQYSSDTKQRRALGLRRSISVILSRRPSVVQRHNLPSFQRNNSTSLQQNNSTSLIPVFRREASMPLLERGRDSSSPNTKSKKANNQKFIKTAPKPDEKFRNKKANSNINNSEKTNIKTTSVIEPLRSSERNISASKCTRGLSHKIKIRDKVMITSSQKKGIVQFVGETKFAKGTWIGVVLNDTAGKNDGSVGGVRYFACPSFRGVFVREDNVRRYEETA